MQDARSSGDGKLKDYVRNKSGLFDVRLFLILFLSFSFSLHNNKSWVDLKPALVDASTGRRSRVSLSGFKQPRHLEERGAPRGRAEGRFLIKEKRILPRLICAGETLEERPIVTGEFSFVSTRETLERGVGKRLSFSHIYFSLLQIVTGNLRTLIRTSFMDRSTQFRNRYIYRLSLIQDARHSPLRLDFSFPSLFDTNPSCLLFSDTFASIELVCESYPTTRRGTNLNEAWSS